MNHLSRFLNRIGQSIKQLGRPGQFRGPAAPSKQHPLELPELEAQFYQDADPDPERVRDRQFSASIRSGRG
jgi:hypothetical protein